MGKSDYLKYYPIIKKFFMVKHKLSNSKMDMLLFLYSEKYWDRIKYKEFNDTMGWDYNRMKDLLRDDWIRVFRKGIQFKLRTIYCLSPKAVNMIQSLYKKLEGEEIPESPRENRIYHKNVPKSTQKYRTFIKTMNALTRKVRLTKHNDLEGAFD